MSYQKLLQQVIGVTLLMLLLVGCGAPAATPTPVPPTPTALLGIEAPLTLGETKLRVTAVKEVERVGDRKAEAGFRLLEVSVEVSQGSPQEVKDWDVSLRDAAGNLYRPFVRGGGVFYGGANAAGWGFSVPNDAAALWLILPGDVPVNLAPLMGAPAPSPTSAPTGKATVVGKVQKDGQPLADNEVKLVMTTKGGDADSQATHTDAEGGFSFEEVMSGTYYLITSVTLEGKVQCSTTSPGFDILLVHAAKKDTGAPITLAMATGSEEPFEVKAGDRVVKDIVFHCK